MGEQTFAALCTKVSYADFSDIRFSHFADAAFLRECSGKILALQHMSLERSFGEAWSEKLLLIRQLCLELR